MADKDAIGTLRLVGDGRSVFLLTPDAGVVWWCTPRVDADPTLWSLLDSHGPAAVFDDVEAVSQAPSPAGAMTWTRLSARCGIVEVRDGLVGGRLTRIVRCVDAVLDVCHRVGAKVFGQPGAVEWTSTQLTAEPGDWVGLAIARGGVERIDGPAAERALNDIQAVFERADRGRDSGQHADRVRDAFAVITALSYAPTGAVPAAATTSVPESIGGDRQFDYRYAWLRDGSLAASVAALHNRMRLAADFLGFIERMADRVFEAPLFTVDGGPVPRETYVDNVSGLHESTPIRVGNAAVDQLQFDALGFVVEAVSTYTREGGRLHRNMWRLVRTIADRCCDAEPADSNGIWEFRERQPFVSADIGRWITLDRALRTARRRRPWTRRRHWRRERDAAAARVLQELRSDGRLPQIYGGDPDNVDASALLIVMFGMLAGEDPRARTLVNAHLDRLSEGVFLRRYRRGKTDEFVGDDATFTPCSWWAVTALSATGQHKQARRRADALCDALPRLLSEQFDPASSLSLGNTPLVWAHAELARALRVLEVESTR